MTGQATSTDQPSAAPAGRRSRRQLLACGTGAFAAQLTAEALARPAPAHAAPTASSSAQTTLSFGHPRAQAG